MKKVLLCVPSLATGGAERFAVELATRFNREELDVTLAETRNDINGTFRDQLNKYGVEVVDLSGKSFFEMMKKQIHFFKHYKPDVVHANTGSVLHIMLACFLYGVPKRLYTVHNEAKLLFGNSRARKLIYKMAFSLFRFTPVAICPTVKETLISDMGLKRNTVELVHNGVDLEKFRPIKKGEHSELKLITVGTLYWIKNQELTINAICDLHAKGINLSLDIVGDGVDRSKLQEIVKNRNAQSFIHFLGIRKNVEEYLQKADVYISSSRTEGLPLSILEAMGCGLPIIATDAGGTKDIVQDGVNGFLVSVDRIEETEEAIIKLYCNKKLLADFSANSLEIVKNWSIQTCVDGYLRLYEE